MSSARKGGVVAVIPARGGSKGIPGKNLVDLGGKPLIAWTIEAAHSARLVDRVIVTTDSHEIAAVARKLGAEVPFMRPSELATDKTPVVEAISHAVAAAGGDPELVLLLQPTSPLRGAARVDEAIRLLRRKKADTVVGVSEPPVHPWQCVRFEKGGMKFAVPRPKRRLNRQDYPEMYAVNGSLYLTKAAYVRRGWLYGKRVEPIVLEAWESVDVDEPDDLALAEFHLRRQRK